MNDQVVEKTDLNAYEQRETALVSDLLSKNSVTVYHGTKNPGLIPSFSYDNKNNDYGKGFYTTPDIELGREWAYSSYTKGDKGYVYTYEIDISGLNILDLTRIDSMHWLAELLANRTLNTEYREALQDTINAIIGKYKLNTDKYDIIIGYRANDSYFTYATDFAGGVIYRDTMETALRNGDLGIQVFIKSENAFNRLRQIGDAEPVSEDYARRYKKRDVDAREKYRRDRMNQTSRLKQRVFDFL